MQTNESKLKQVLAAAFGGNPESVDRDWSMETVERWDSLNHLKLVLALEEEFGVSFTEEQLTNLFSYESIEGTLAECGVNFPPINMDAASCA
jgi:acyl carrier protein